MRTIIAPLLIGQDPFAVSATSTSCVWLPVPGVWRSHMGHHRQSLRPAALQALGRLHDRVRAYSSCMEVRSGEQRAEDALARLEEGLPRHQTAHPRLDAGRGRLPGGEGARSCGRPHGDHVDANQAVLPGAPQPGPGPVWDFQRPWTRRESSSGSGALAAEPSTA